MERRQFGRVFDGVAEEYDAVRRGYPPALVDRAIERGGLTTGSRVVEVGSGTGKLTETLVERGLVVDAVEPGANMAAAARRRVGENAPVTFHIGRFEDVELPEQAFGGVFSATAFHWVDPRVGWAKTASLLEGGGVLALLVHTMLRDEQTAAIHEGFVAALRTHAPKLAEETWAPRELDAILDGVEERSDNASAVWDWLMGSGRHGMTVPEAAGLYRDVEVASEVTTIEETADDVIAHLRTTSLYFMVDADRRQAFEEDERRVVERHGGVIRSSLASLLMTAVRTDVSPAAAAS
jgi:SAM-dependent methyltransferase